MLSEHELMKRACNELIKVFGREYLQENYEETLVARGMSDSDTFMLFVGIKDSEDLPEHPVTKKGWTVYGHVRLDANTGLLKSIDYMLE